MDDSRLAVIFCRDVLAFFVGKELLSPEGAERVGKYMIRPLLSVKCLSLNKKEETRKAPFWANRR